MSTPLRLAARLAVGSGAACDVDSEVPPSSTDTSLYYRDVSWSGTLPALAPRTPNKLRQAIDDATARATAIVAAGDASMHLAAEGAAQSKDPTIALRTAVHDAVGQLEAVISDFTGRAVRTQRSCNEHCGTISRSIADFDSGSKYTQWVGFDIPRLIQETSLGTDLDFMQRYGPTIGVVENERYLAVLALLSSRALDVGELHETKKKISSDILKPLLPLDDAGIAQLLVDVNLFTASDVLATLRTELLKQKARIEPLEKRLAELDARAAEAKRREDFATADAVEEEIIGVMREIFLISKSSLESVHASATDSGASMATKLEAIMNEASIARAAKLNDAANGQAHRDAAALDKDRIVRQQKHQQTLANYAAAAARSNERLQRNAHQQNLQWEEVRKALGRIDELRSEAETIVKGHLQLTDIEQKRRKEYAEYQESFAAHREYVRRLQSQTETAGDFLQHVRAYLSQARDKIATMRIEERLAEMSRDLRAALEAQYAQLSSRAAKRLHALEARSTNACRQKDEQVFLVKQAPVVADEDTRYYTQRLEELDKSIVHLSAKARHAAELFDSDQNAYLNAVCTFDDFDRDNNAAVRAVELRRNLRDQYTATFGNLVTHHTADVHALRDQCMEFSRHALAIAEVRKTKAAVLH